MEEAAEDEVAGVEADDELLAKGMLTTMDFGISSFGSLIEDRPSRNFSKPLMYSNLLSFTTEGLMLSLDLGSSSSKISPGSRLSECCKGVGIVIEDGGGLSMSKIDFGGLAEVTGDGGSGGGGG